MSQTADMSRAAMSPPGEAAFLLSSRGTSHDFEDVPTLRRWSPLRGGEGGRCARAECCVTDSC